MNISKIARAAGVLLLFAIPLYSANAVTAWILWERTSIDVQESEWKVTTATDTKNDCRIRFINELLSTQKIMDSKPWRETINDTDAHVTWMSEGKGGKKIAYEKEYLCLPDTVDPRRMKTQSPRRAQ